jgi:endo-1,4-beta-xylanase
MKTLFFILLNLLLTGFIPSSEVTLKDAFEEDFLIGAAVSYGQADGQDQKSRALLKKHFSSITSENMLKWGPVHPELGQYNFAAADNFVQLGLDNDLFIIGHTLVWHQQIPEWVFENEPGKPLGRQDLLNRMENHINTVAGRYRDEINGWDVVNEALEDDGSLGETKWLEIIGEDYLEKAFTFAKKAAPEAELYYNDYNLWKPEKREGAVRLVKSLLEKGIRVDGIGMQGHYSLTHPEIAQVEASIIAFSELGLKVMITELDVDVLPRRGSAGADLNSRDDGADSFNPYTEGLPDEVHQQLAKRYAELFTLFHKHRDKISRVTLWGVTDANSWLNNWPVRERTNYPLLFDRLGQPKPAFEAVISVAE